MQEFFYNLGGGVIMIVPLLIGLFCFNRIRKNMAEIKKLENKDDKKQK